MAETRPNPDEPLRILYCRCAYANVVPEETKDAVLEKLCAAGRPFDSVSDLCEMSARRDPALKTIAERGHVKIAACYERAVRGLFRAADAPLADDSVHILNMRTDEADAIVDHLLDDNAAPPKAAKAGEDDEADEAGKEPTRRESA